MKFGKMDIKSPYDTASMTTTHLLQGCPQHEVQRHGIWPNKTALKEMLYGNTGAPRRTATFVWVTNVDVSPKETIKWEAVWQYCSS